MNNSLNSYVLSIAGFDPSSGAGITSDCKTFEACGVYGLGVCSAITFQTEDSFLGVEWIAVDTIIRQLDTLLSRYTVRYCKIGLIKDLDTLEIIVQFLINRDIRIVWDPILNASTGFTFHQLTTNTLFDVEKLKAIVSQLFLITPNRVEFEQLTTALHYTETQQWLSLGLQALLLKGGHNSTNDCADLLYTSTKITSIEGKRITGYDKHGTGCVLSSVITAYLAIGYSLTESCTMAKRYVEAFITSSDTLLGVHSQNHSYLSTLQVFTTI